MAKSLAIMFISSEKADWPSSAYSVDDEIGAANLITPRLVLDAAKLIKSGRTYSLAVEMDRLTPAFRECPKWRRSFV